MLRDHLHWGGSGQDVKVFRLRSQQQVPDCATYQVALMTCMEQLLLAMSVLAAFQLVSMLLYASVQATSWAVARSNTLLHKEVPNASQTRPGCDMWHRIVCPSEPYQLLDALTSSVIPLADWAAACPLTIANRSAR